MDQQKIGKFLKLLRGEKNMTQEELAEQLNVSGRTVSRWETGKNMPDISLLVSLAEFYNVSVMEIINGERESEDMNEELKDTILKVGDYMETDKKNLLKRVRILGIIGIVLQLGGMIMVAIKPNSPSPVYSYIEGLLLGIGLGTMIMMVLYVTGQLDKLQRMKKDYVKRKIIIIICAVLSFVVSVLAVLFWI